MAARPSNRLKAFADLVSVDAWHDAFKGKRKGVDLHADIVFGTARVGQDTDVAITFRLSVTRADVVIVLPDGEPIGVDPSSVRRDDPHPTVKRTQTFETKSEGAITAKVKAELGVEPAASFAANAHVSSGVTNTEKLVATTTAPPVLVTLSTTADGSYRWTCTPLTGRKLQGRGWDAATEPCLKLLDGRKTESHLIAPTVRIEVGCLREDLIIEDLELKDPTIWETVRHRTGFKNRMAAAEAYIRNELMAHGLKVGALDQRFSPITLADVTAEPRG
ncbi:hypothetical protein [Hyphomicrobium sp. DMF-1]|jgi:hypothetical protein|uniref:hypothetical protein n=1 Tax=Hyphomicrobium sp. DMF-1 TaxID=3019544 RepID=UPI0022EBE97B|nr:hypothetical protein [Hyphomicrobium sp. DMF-1]WBT39182.1 hypothetical protein PE058_04685 [Hyphomicrobium sp. DMF-1]